MNSFWRAAAVLTLLVQAAYFARSTEAVRIANDDDVSLQQVFSSHDKDAVDSFFMEWSTREARFYFALPEYRELYEIYHIKSPVVFSTVRTFLLFAQFILWGGLLARLTGNEASGWLYVIAASAALHIPAIFYPVLSYPAYSIGSLCLILAFHSYLYGLERPHPKWVALSAFLLVCALICHENFIIFTLLFPAFSLLQDPKVGSRAVVLQCLPLALVSAAYIGFYLTFRHLYPTSYGGTVLTIDIHGTLQSWSRQTIAAVPGVELLLNRAAPYPNVGPLLKSPREIESIILSMPVGGIITALLSAVVCWQLAGRVGNVKPSSVIVLMVLAVAVALPNAIPSFAFKYQLSSHHRFYPYVYSFSAYCWGVALAVAGWSYWRSRADSPRLSGALARAALLVSLAAIFLSAQASNAHTLGLLLRWFN